MCPLAHPPLPESNCRVRRLPWRGLVTGGMWGRYCSEQRRHLWAIICGSPETRNAELDIKWCGRLSTTAVVARPCNAPPLQLIYIKVCVALHCEFSSIRLCSCSIVVTDRQFCTVMFAVCKGVVLSLTTYMSRTQFHIFLSCIYTGWNQGCWWQWRIFFQMSCQILTAI